ncbi:MAG: hypothetical protein AB7U82_27810 [Blastocatellales bacterium]
MKDKIVELAAPFAIVMGALLSATARRRKVRETIWIFAAGSTLAALSHSVAVFHFGEPVGIVVTFVVSLTGGNLLQGVIDYVARNKSKLAARIVNKVLSKYFPQEGGKDE